MTVSVTLLVLAQPKALRLRLVEARHVADGAGLDQRRDDGGAERAGSAGDHHVTIAEVHERIIADLRSKWRQGPRFASSRTAAGTDLLSCAERRISG